jgi:peptide-methionine (S)-S-oxide reductase
VKIFRFGGLKKMVETQVNSASTEGAKGPQHLINTPFEKATFGMGCFWGCDSLFGATMGVLRTRVGYAGGSTPNPVYRNLGDHTEVIEIDFDPKKITYDNLLQLFWNNHEYGLTNKMKRQYMSIIFYHSEGQKKIASASLVEEAKKRTPEKIITEIYPAGVFYPAEDYHQKYRLQTHKDLCKSLNLNSHLLQVSHLAARLNGYLVGVGGIKQFLSEVDELGLTPEQIQYVKVHLQNNEGGSLYC